MRSDTNFFDQAPPLPREPTLGEPPHYANGLDDPGYVEALFAEAADEREPVDSAPEASDDLESYALEPIGRQYIPPRPWAYGNYLLFGKTAVLGAVDGGGKGAIATVMLLAHIFGQPLLGEKIWRHGRVAIITYEDDETEWHRRIAAACHHYQLDYEHALESIIFIRRPGGRVSFVALDRDGAIFPDGDKIIAHILAFGATLLIVDPFNHTHALDDGNNNVMIAKVAAEMDRIAAATEAAGLVLHHLRKGSSGQPDDLMGATSLRATFRSARILQRMTKDAAEGLNIKDAWRYIRIGGTKENYAPPPDKATWFKLIGVRLENASEEYPDGDDIGVATSWAPPSPWDGIPMDIVCRILRAIDEGLGAGEYYTGSRRGRANTRWGGTVIVDACDKSPDQAAAIIAQWIESGVLLEGTYHSTAEGKELACIRANPDKLAEMEATSSAPAQWDC